MEIDIKYKHSDIVVYYREQVELTKSIKYKCGLFWKGEIIGCSIDYDNHPIITYTIGRIADAYKTRFYIKQEDIIGLYRNVNKDLLVKKLLEKINQNIENIKTQLVLLENTNKDISNLTQSKDYNAAIVKYRQLFEPLNN